MPGKCCVTCHRFRYRAGKSAARLVIYIFASLSRRRALTVGTLFAYARHVLCSLWQNEIHLTRSTSTICSDLMPVGLLLVIFACDCNVWAVHIKFARMRSNRARQGRTALRHQFMRKFPRMKIRLKCRRHSSTFFVSFSSAFDDVRARARAEKKVI